MASLQLPYCGNLPHLVPVWIDEGVSPCMISTAGGIGEFTIAFFIAGTASFFARKPKDGDTPVGTHTWKRIQLLQSNLSWITAAVLIARLIAVSVFQNMVYKVWVVDCYLSATAWIFTAMQLRGRRSKNLSGAGLSRLFWFWVLVRLAVEAASYRSKYSYFSESTTNSSIVDITCFALRSLLTVSVVVCEFSAHHAQQQSALRLRAREGASVNSSDPEESRPLLREDAAKTVKSVKQRTGSTFSGFSAKVKLLWPFLWPRGHFILQVRIVLCIITLVGIRVVNVLVPLYYKRIIDKLSTQVAPDHVTADGFLHSTSALNDMDGADGGATLDAEHTEFPLGTIVVYVVLRFLQGGGIGSMGLLSNLRTFLWIDVQQYTSRSIRVRLFKHFHDQDLKWHLSRKTGEVLRMMERGSDSINNLLSYVIFNIAPTLIDIGIAVVYFTTAFGVYYGIIVFTTMALYIWVTIAVTEWRTKFRRTMNTFDNAIRQKATDSLLNAETVKLYSGEKYEVATYLKKLLEYQSHEWRSLASLALLNVSQSVIIAVGLAAGAILCGYDVSTGDLSVGDFVLFITYVAQLYAPLNWFGTYFRMIQAAFIDMENMIDLLDIKATVVDRPGAKPLALTLPPPPRPGHDASLAVAMQNACSIEFNNVSFSYEPRKPILKNLSFSVLPGQTCAIVGSTGSGKSTIMRLLFRFYDVDAGSVTVNGENVATCTLESLRGIMGVVPQDTVLFHDTIRYNMKYGRSTATDDEVIEAAKGAEIHDSILSFPDQYETVVGERGLKLSGGEKQRVAIARTILKQPLIVMLDEATSALDTETERSIQSSLNQLCKGRTTVVIAHRLSTVVHADNIIVLKHGEIVEQGVHRDLMARDGQYADMWRAQAEAAQNADADVTPTTPAPPAPTSAHGHGHRHGHGH
eukprot:m.1143203 g.1143203  ORF g.1143203 m.1143203 type:complete len:915 (+) comp24457_c0_seq16:87-2831(+)